MGIDSLTFDVGGAELHEQSEMVRTWVTPERVGIHVRYRPAPPDWTFDLNDP